MIHALASNRKYYILADTSAVFTDCRNHRMGKSSPQCPSSMADENILHSTCKLLAHTYLILLLEHNKMLHGIWTLDSAVFHFVWIYFKFFFTFDHQHCKQTLPRSQGYIWPTVECRKPPVNKENYIQLFIPIF